jgi:hypothetical protein
MAEALEIVRRNSGVFGSGKAPSELRNVIEWFVDPPCELLVHEALCTGDELHFIGTVLEPTVPKKVGHLRYDVYLTPGTERVHLDLYWRDEYPPDPPMSMKPHLRRGYEAMERAGIPLLELEAGLQTGPTFWAYAGVDFAAGQALLTHLEILTGLLANASTAETFASPKDVLTAYPNATATISEAYKLSVALSRASGTPVWVINPLDYLRDDLGLRIDDQLPVGQAALFAISPWQGRVDLSNPGTSDIAYRDFLGV